MRAVEKRGYDELTTCGGPSRSARGRQREQAGRHEDKNWDRDEMGRRLHHPGRKAAGTGLSWKGGVSPGRGGSAAGGGKEQEMPSEGRQADGGAGGRAAEKSKWRMNESARKGQVTTGDRSRPGRSRGQAAAGVQSSTTVRSTVMDWGRKGGADKVSRCRVGRGLVTGQPGVQWRVAPGWQDTGEARNKGHPPLGLDHPRQRVVRSTGPKRSRRSKTARGWPSELEHPEDVHLHPPIGTSRAGRGDKRAARGPGAPGGKRRIAPD